jgi:small subunit ribosomal protein S13
LARISGVDLPKNKKIEISLRYIFGIGPSIATAIIKTAGVRTNILTKELSEDEIVRLRDAISNYRVEGDLKRDVAQNIRRLKEIGCYKGSRHRKSLPVRGQRTHTNARTKKGKRVAVAGKKKVTK